MYGDMEVTMETGEIARQADGAVMVGWGDTRVLVTVVAEKKAVEGQDFFPLTVHYQEKFYAAGKIPGGFLKRESRPSEYETLTSRLIDRPIRPLFPEGFNNEVQVIATVVALDPEYSAEVPAMIGTSAALALSGVPFNGPIAAAQVGYWDGQYHLNPTLDELEDSELVLSVAGTEHAVLMVESEADELPEQVMLGAVVYGHQQMQVAIAAIKEFAQQAGKPAWQWQAPAKNTALIDAVKAVAGEALNQVYSITDKMQRYAAMDSVKENLMAQLLGDGEGKFDKESLSNAFKNLQAEIVRGRILRGEARIDGRDTDTVRPITIRTGVLPQVHGSALFTRGETQALVVTTLGTEKDAKIVDEVAGSYKDNFILHYNFPPFSVGEVGRLGTPGRREIGHGQLARRGVTAVLPTLDEFPYTIRVVSEITESNGSSSMASVCGSSLAMMDAGVPITAPVSGIAMGLIKEGDSFAVLTDILGDEDHLGDMDFKVAGTAKGVTALQMDIKIDGITEEIMRVALEKAHVGRNHILQIMNESIAKPRQDLADNAPRYTIMKIAKDKIGDVIGKGGAVIKKLQEDTQTVVEIMEDGTVKIAATNGDDAMECRRIIEEITMDVEVGKVYHGKVIKVVEFGAFVRILPNKEGLLHISKISEERIEDINTVIAEGDELDVKVIEIDRQGRLRLSKRDV